MHSLRNLEAFVTELSKWCQPVPGSGKNLIRPCHPSHRKYHGLHGQFVSLLCSNTFLLFPLTMSTSHWLSGLRPNQVSSQWKRCQSSPLATTLLYKAIFPWIQEGKSIPPVPMEGNLLLWVLHHGVVPIASRNNPFLLSPSWDTVGSVAGPIPLKALGSVFLHCERFSVGYQNQSLVGNHQGIGKRPS